MIKIGNLSLSKILFGSIEVTDIFSGSNRIYENIKVLPYPTLSGSYTYNGSEQTAVFTDYDPTTLIATGLTGTNAGSYTATFTPREGCCWQDKSTTPYSINWSIAKATGTLSLNPGTISLSASSLSATVTVTTNSSGRIVVYTVPSGVSTSISGNVITITGDGATDINNASVRVAVAGDANHTAPPYRAFTIKADYRLIVGGRIFYVGDDNGATYKFWDSSGNELTTHTVDGLANAKYYRIISGTPTIDKFYVYDSNLLALVRAVQWGKYNTTIGITNDGIGLGKSNTNAALAQSGWEDDSIFACVQSWRTNNLRGCNDWYIGSASEHAELCNSGLVDWYSSMSTHIWTSVESTNKSAYSFSYNAPRIIAKDNHTNYHKCFAMRSF